MTGQDAAPGDETVLDDSRRQSVPDELPGPGQPFGRYELIERIGQGGMGVVFKARHESLDRLVALKILNTRQQRAVDVERFANEARAAARLVHPGIVRIHDVGEVDGLHYLACELIDGIGLDRLIAGERPSPERALAIVAGLAEAVDYAHQKGVIHRDLKPSNVLIDGAGRPMLTDFGLARRTDASQKLTQTGQVLGTPAYMAPEQVSNDHGPIGPATDVHGLGAVLYELLTGRAPFHGENMFNTLHQVLTRLPPPPHELVEEVPPAYSQLCLRCLAKDPADRFPTAGALAEACHALLQGRRPQAERAWRRPSKPRTQTRSPGAGPRRVPAALLLLAGATLGIAIGLAGGYWRWGRVLQRSAARENAPPDQKQQYTEALLKRDTRQAFELITRYLALHPTEWAMRRSRLDLAQRLERYDEAIRELELIAQGDKLAPGEEQVLLRLYARQNRVQPARALVERAATREPERGRLLALQFVRDLDQHGQSSQAVAFLKQVLSRAPHPYLWRELARLQLTAGQPLAALRAWLNARTSIDTDPTALSELRKILAAWLASSKQLPLDTRRSLLSFAERDAGFARELGDWLAADSGRVQGLDRKRLDGLTGSPSLNERSAIGSLRTLATAQEEFRRDRIVDQDQDGQGEYGYLPELSGTATTRGGTAMVNPAYISRVFGEDAIAVKSGYCFLVYLPTATGAARLLRRALPAADARAANAQERRYMIYAWPLKYGVTGRHAFCVNQQGEVYATTNERVRYSGSTTTPAPGAALDPKGASPATLDAPLGGRATGDGQLWVSAN